MEKGVQNSVGPKQRMHETKSFEKKISYNCTNRAVASPPKHFTHLQLSIHFHVLIFPATVFPNEL